MKDNELLKVKKDYDSLVMERDRLKAIKERMLELEKIEGVLEYVELYEKYRHGCANALDENLDKKTNEDLAYRSAHIENIVTPTTNIYCYIATCKKDEDGDLEEIKIGSKDAEVVIFANIEAYKEYKKVKIEDLTDFINNNIVIYPEEIIDCGQCYDVAQKEFFATSVIEGQDVAVQKFTEYSKKKYPWRRY